MLVLSRKENESIAIEVGGTRIVVLLKKIDGHRAKIGVSAPLNVAIVRTEIEEVKHEA